MEATKKIYDLHAEHKAWLNTVSFYKDELKILTHRLEEVASKNTNKDILAKVEHFQNQFVLNKEQVDILLHDVNRKEQELQKNINDNPVAVDHRQVNDEQQLRDRVETFKTLMEELKKEFNAFLTKVM
jgi:uncharacterized membrane protein YccC